MSRKLYNYKTQSTLRCQKNHKVCYHSVKKISPNFYWNTSNVFHYNALLLTPSISHRIATMDMAYRCHPDLTLALFGGIWFWETFSCFGIMIQIPPPWGYCHSPLGYNTAPNPLTMYLFCSDYDHIQDATVTINMSTYNSWATVWTSQRNTAYINCLHCLQN